MTKNMLFKKLICPSCKANNCIEVNQNDSFITDEYVDIPAKCNKCQEEVRLLYDFKSLTLD